MSEKEPKQLEVIADEIVIGPDHLTRFERARIIGARGLQISLGAPILTKMGKELSDPIIIAEIELDKNVLPLTISRLLPDGKFQNIPLSWLLKGT
ncbi:MAG TPA: DNA-directed RNA polymerase subunit K [candidate division Zixibacteria bacterium]|nr:DNA-directed RNA polymerase subunit K [candidate division Zixibacteria bacterium]